MFRTISHEEYLKLRAEFKDEAQWSILKKIIGLKFMYARKEIAMSQELLARLMGVSRPKIVRWEAGQYFPDCKELLMISKLSGRPIQWFFEP